MAKQIIHGIGKLVMRDFRDPKTIIGFTDLQDLSVESSSSKDDITGGNKMFPIASFKKDQALKISGTNASFDYGLMTYLDGADKTVGVIPMTDVIEVRIPDSGTIMLPNTPVVDSVVITGYTTAADKLTVATKKFFADPATKELTFAVDDAGESVVIVYQYNSSETAVEYSITEVTMSKPFSCEYVFPIYDEDTQIIAHGMIKIYKAQCSTGFKLDAKHQSAYAPKFEAEAKDAQRIDKKMWSFFIDGVEV